MTSLSSSELPGEDQDKFDVGKDAVWSVSSYQEGYGVEELTDPSLHTYWKSSGPLPHQVNIQFKKKTTLDDVWLYVDCNMDKANTPSKVAIRCGRDFNHLQEVKVVNLPKPTGWVLIPLYDPEGKYIKAKVLQIAVLSVLGIGRNACIRCIKVHSPAESNNDAIEA
ncbi:anaphase-promoting complex subunit 10-like [Macrobrachium rosenbergii]|uniref:anaphase-promoting complex subunit 10-like n=1 Tax=Macrobrachium rosenbergii TaxID=79674 RepID=UPI0034D4698D